MVLVQAMLGWVDGPTLAINLRLIVGLFAVAFAVILLILMAWIGIRILDYQKELRLAQEQARKERFREDGQPYPPTDRGLCDVCARPFEKVYHLPSGQRMCEDCYRQMVHESHQQAICPPDRVERAEGEDGIDRSRSVTDDAAQSNADGRQGL